MPNNKQTTALQQLKWFMSDGLDNFDESVKVSEIWAKINEFLPIEREQIEDAYNQAYRDAEIDLHTTNKKDISEYENAEQYFTSTFITD